MGGAGGVEGILTDNAPVGVSAAQADLEGKCATVTLSAPVSDEELKEAVTAAGYEVVGIQ